MLHKLRFPTCLRRQRARRQEDPARHEKLLVRYTGHTRWEVPLMPKLPLQRKREGR